MNIISQIITGAVKLWHEVEQDIEADVAKVKAALPASALPGFDAAVADLKQVASDTLGLVDGAIQSVAPVVVSTVEKVLDDALVTYSNGLLLPLVPMTNKGVEDISRAGLAAIKAWELKAKASLASNNAAGQTGG